MTLNPAARATARRNVAERVDRLLNVLQRARRLPNRRELFWLRHALVNLEKAEYPAGEEAMDKAERTLPIPGHAANDPSTNKAMPVMLTKADDVDVWLNGTLEEALKLQKPRADEEIVITPYDEKNAV